MRGGGEKERAKKVSEEFEIKRSGRVERQREVKKTE